jgi:hypothetical protein
MNYLYLLAQYYEARYEAYETMKCHPAPFSPSREHHFPLNNSENLVEIMEEAIENTTVGLCMPMDSNLHRSI